MNTRNTKQKSIIFESIRNDKTHPTINQLYEKIGLIDKEIGQATVYRNINKLVEEGKVIKIPTKDMNIHYDGNTIPHSHLYCKKCNHIYDIFDDYSKIVKEVEKNSSIIIDSVSLLYEGICEDCNEKI